MYIDSRLEFSVKQALSATAASTNTIDLSTDRDIGVGRPVFIAIGVDVAADGTTGDESYSVAVQTDDNSAFSSPTTITTLTIPNNAKAGARFVTGFPYNNERYVRLNYTLGGTTPSVTLSAFLTDQEPVQWQAYPDAI